LKVLGVSSFGFFLSGAFFLGCSTFLAKFFEGEKQKVRFQFENLRKKKK